MPTEDRGFASMDHERQREIASKGGRAAHLKGTAHEWTSQEAREAGRKGGLAQQRKRREYLGVGVQPSPLQANSQSDITNPQDWRVDESD